MSAWEIECGARIAFADGVIVIAQYYYHCVGLARCLDGSVHHAALFLGFWESQNLTLRIVRISHVATFLIGNLCLGYHVAYSFQYR